MLLADDTKRSKEVKEIKRLAKMWKSMQETNKNCRTGLTALLNGLRNGRWKSMPRRPKSCT